MEGLLQEVHILSKKLELKERMELSYLDEIDQLKHTIEFLQQQVQQQDSRKTPTNEKSTVLLLEDRIARYEDQVAELTTQIKVLKERELDLQERLNSVEFRQEGYLSECSISTLDGHKAENALLIHEITRLKEELTNLEASGHIERSKLERQLMELEDDRNSLQGYTAELERQLKESRSELADIRGQLEAVEIQANSVEKTRGNSVFAELEDRRRRAEQLVIEQRQLIDQLNLRNHQIEADAKRKLTDLMQKQEARFRERDTNFVDELVAERQRLLTENARLMHQVEHLEELQLDQERGTIKLAKAFNVEGYSQASFISSLERRINCLQIRLKEYITTTNNLRQRLIDSGLVRRKLQSELWERNDQIEYLRKQLQEKFDSQKENKCPDKSDKKVVKCTTGHSLGDELKDVKSQTSKKALNNDQPQNIHSTVSSMVEPADSNVNDEKLELPGECPTS